MTSRRRIFATLGLALAAVLLVAPFAHAQAADVGENLGNWGQRQLEPLFYFGVGIGALALLFTRKFAALALFAVVALVVGLFVLAPETVAQIIRGISREL